ncbi:tripartite tricarboxylate transporter substrate binding protein [Hominifimenecus sp. rT4P-3]|uniref:tripartite tricarboxylate transporter substrate binding protein n=1 Tax=Hominifimenecus sp. rT4P-3 TaxID=3242979 RepID=UPI003DA62ED2
MNGKVKKALAFFMAGVLAMGTLAGCSSEGGKDSTAAGTQGAGTAAGTQAAGSENAGGDAGDYPNQAITGVSTFSTSSGTFSDAVKICGLAEQFLGGSITVVDRAGGSGAVGTDFVYSSKPDGYTLLCGTDSVSLFGVMELSDITYDDFIPVLLAYGKVFYLIGNKDSKYNCLQDLIDDAKANPGRVTVAITGAGSVPAVWFSLFAKHFDVQFNIVQYEGNGDAMTALMGGHVDAFITNTQQSLSYVESGDVKPITLLFDNDIPILEGTEKLSEAYPELAKYSGFGNFFQISVHKDTPQAIVDKLKDAFLQAYNTPEFQQYIEDNGHAPLGISGDEAIEYEKRHQSMASYIMYDVGATEINPADLGIERLAE